MTEIRASTPDDVGAIRRIQLAAFGRNAESELALGLLAREPACVSLVARESDSLVGHVLLSPVRVEGRAFARAPFGLGPLAVLPERQRAGVGSALARAGIDVCRSLGAPFLVVLGHPAYYPRFGFAPAARFGLTFADAGPRDAFMALELAPDALAGCGGRVRYAEEFHAEELE
ncbi:MAG: GNAT family N-acetyltransferase [Myxococcota bacterium]